MGAIEVRGVGFSYGGQDGGREVLTDVSVSFVQGEFTCIVGHSGCGKTTLLRLIAGLDAPTRGNVTINGETVSGPNENEAIVFQQYPLFPWMKVRKNVVFGIRHSQNKHSKKEALDRADAFLEKVGMLDSANAYPYQLSGGMKQRVAIARALAMDPEVLLLDEPFGALDARRRLELQQLVEELWMASAPKKNIVFVTHDINEAILLADRIVFMRPSKIEKVIEVPFGRPRSKADIANTREYKDLQNELLHLFYLDEVTHD